MNLGPLRLAVVLLALAFLFTSFDLSQAGSMRSASSRSTRSSSAAPVYVTVPAPAPTSSSSRANSDDDYAYGDQAVQDTALIRLKVPADAKIWIDGKAMSPKGALRPFVTTKLEPGKDYVYEVRANWTENGRAVERTRKITFQAGDRLTLNLSR
jgi:uncharacterized protein (TIGR03000 family)